MKYILFLIGLLILMVVATRVVYSKVRSLGKSSSDLYFDDNTWNNFTIGGFQFKESENINYDEYKKRTIEHIQEWEKTTVWYKNKSLEGKIIEDSNITKKELLKTLDNSYPERVMDGHSYPFLVYFLEKEKYIYMLLNHYYCDGVTLHDFMAYTIYHLKEHPTRFVKYKYIPIISDIMLLCYLFRVTLHMIKPSKPLTPDKENSYIIRKEIHYQGKINREMAIAKVMQFIFKYLNKDSLCVSNSVGFDDSGVIYNRIGTVIIDIPKMQTEEEYTQVIKNKIDKYKGDALASYDLVRNFPVGFLRYNFNRKVDMILTSFRTDVRKEIDEEYCAVKNLNYELASFIGKNPDEISIYVLANTMFHDNKIIVSLRSNTLDIDISRMLQEEDNIEKVYDYKENKS